MAICRNNLFYLLLLFSLDIFYILYLDSIYSVFISLLSLLFLLKFRKEVKQFILRKQVPKAIMLLNIKVFISRFLCLPLMELGAYESSYEYYDVVVLLLIAPLLEEGVFRYCIVKRGLNILMMLAFLTYISVHSAWIFLILLLFIPFILHSSFDDNIKLIIYIVLVSAMSFSIAHIDKEPFNVLCFIHFSISGIVYAIIRIKYGMSYAITTHIMYNTYIFCLSGALRIVFM